MNLKHRPLWMHAFEARSPSQEIPENEFRARNAFNRDLSIVVHSNFFKRLSHKTQVYSLPYNDHVHTRLTHSIEASQIGRQISRYFCVQVIKKLIHTDDYYKLASEIEELTAAACLAHDIGHAPFGHTGKKTIEEFGDDKNEIHSFDDNKQVVRILLNEIWIEKIKPSGPFVASILKKKTLKDNCYPSEELALNEILKRLDLLNFRHPASIFMEAADDIAYLSADLLDFIAIYSGKDSFKNTSNFNSFSELECVDNLGKENGKNLKFYFDDALSSSNEQKIQDFSDHFLRISLDHVFKVIDHFANVFMSGNPTIEDIPQKLSKFLSENAAGDGLKKDENLLYSLCLPKKGQILFDLKKQVYQGTILQEPFIKEQDRLAKIVLTGILEELYSLKIATSLEGVDVFQKLPDEAQKYFKTAKDQGMLFPAITDLVSGMTDRYAIAFWKEIAGLSALERLNARPFKKTG